MNDTERKVELVGNGFVGLGTLLNFINFISHAAHSNKTCGPIFDPRPCSPWHPPIPWAVSFIILAVGFTIWATGGAIAARLNPPGGPASQPAASTPQASTIEPPASTAQAHVAPPAPDAAAESRRRSELYAIAGLVLGVIQVVVAIVIS